MYIWLPNPICLSLFMQPVRRDCHLALPIAGSSREARMATMATTTSNSIKVKPRRQDGCGWFREVNIEDGFIGFFSHQCILKLMGRKFKSAQVSGPYKNNSHHCSVRCRQRIMPHSVVGFHLCASGGASSVSPPSRSTIDRIFYRLNFQISVKCPSEIQD